MWEAWTSRAYYALRHACCCLQIPMLWPLRRIRAPLDMAVSRFQQVFGRVTIAQASQVPDDSSAASSPVVVAGPAFGEPSRSEPLAPAKVAAQTPVGRMEPAGGAQRLWRLCWTQTLSSTSPSPGVPFARLLGVQRERRPPTAGPL